MNFVSYTNTSTGLISRALSANVMELRAAQEPIQSIKVSWYKLVILVFLIVSNASVFGSWFKRMTAKRHSIGPLHFLQTEEIYSSLQRRVIYYPNIKRRLKKTLQKLNVLRLTSQNWLIDSLGQSFHFY